MTLCFTMAIVVFLFYPVGVAVFAPWTTPMLTTHQETAQKTLEEVDFLFDPSRNIWVFRDRQACKVGAIFDRDMTHGEALTKFDGKEIESARVDHIESVP